MLRNLFRHSRINRNSSWIDGRSLFRYTGHRRRRSRNSIHLCKLFRSLFSTETVLKAANLVLLQLTTSLQALAYLVVVVWEGRWGGGISRFHSYYALFCSFGWAVPLSAASLTATHYGCESSTLVVGCWTRRLDEAEENPSIDGGNHQKTGVRLFAYRTDFK